MEKNTIFTKVLKDGDIVKCFLENEIRTKREWKEVYSCEFYREGMIHQFGTFEQKPDFSRASISKSKKKYPLPSMQPALEIQFISGKDCLEGRHECLLLKDKNLNYDLSVACFSECIIPSKL